MQIVETRMHPGQRMIARQLPLWAVTPFGLTVPEGSELKAVTAEAWEGLRAWFLVPEPTTEAKLVYLLLVNADGDNLPSASAARHVATVITPAGVGHVFEVLPEYLNELTDEDYKFMRGQGAQDV